MSVWIRDFVTTVRTVWQWTATPLDQDRFNGALDRVRAFALG